MRYKKLIEKRNIIVCKYDLELRVAIACLHLLGKLFHVLAPLYEKDFCPLEDLFCSSHRSVAILRRF